MYNYIKCKYSLDLSDEEKESIDRDWEKITFLCNPIEKKVGEFLIRGNGELCHNVTEFEKVSDDEIGESGVVWNGSEYARIKSTEWVRVDFTGEITIESQVISKTTDADIKIDFKFEHGYVVSHKPNIILIDNSERLSHDKKIKELAIKRAKKFNSTEYKLYDTIIRRPLIKILHGVGYIGSGIQDLAWKLERQLNK